jgi:hypothetical protein
MTPFFSLIEALEVAALVADCAREQPDHSYIEREAKR